MKNPFKRKKDKFPTQPVPRSMEEVQKAYLEQRSQAGEVQYQIHVLNKNLDQINAALESLNYEAAARQKLDKEAAAAKGIAEADKKAVTK